MKTLDAVDACSDRQRTEQQRPDAAALIGVRHGKGNLRRTRVVFIPDEAGIGDDRPVYAVGNDPDEVVNIIDLDQ